LQSFYQEGNHLNHMNINKIVNSKQCMSCGICEYNCPRSAISLSYSNKKGLFFPNIDSDKCIDCGLCINGCPSIYQNSENVIGKFNNLLLTHAKNERIRYGATSGGAINSLVRYLADSEIVDCVLLLKHDGASTVETSYCWINKSNVQELENNPREFASRYVSFPTLVGLNNIPKDVKKIAVVGTSCQIKALCLTKLKCMDLVLKIGVTCSGGMSYKATNQYKRLKNMQNSKIYYRGNGWPGNNSLVIDGKSIDFCHTGSLFERMFSSQVFKNPGCRQCKDHFAELADISFCDYWNQEEREREFIGNSCTIVRSNNGLEVIQQAIEFGYLEIVKNLDLEDVLNTQMHVLKAKKGDMHEKCSYKCFIKVVDYIFEHKIYLYFGYKSYNVLAKIYRAICEKSNIGLETKKD
jgi:coenzyme F420 hydrogenase subunit beta